MASDTLNNSLKRLRENIKLVEQLLKKIPASKRASVVVGDYCLCLYEHRLTLVDSQEDYLFVTDMDIPLRVAAVKKIPEFIELSKKLGGNIQKDIDDANDGLEQVLAEYNS